MTLDMVLDIEPSRLGLFRVIVLFVVLLIISYIIFFIVEANLIIDSTSARIKVSAFISLVLFVSGASITVFNYLKLEKEHDKWLKEVYVPYVVEQREVYSFDVEEFVVLEGKTYATYRVSTGDLFSVQMRDTESSEAYYDTLDIDISRPQDYVVLGKKGYDSPSTSFYESWVYKK